MNVDTNRLQAIIAFAIVYFIVTTYKAISIVSRKEPLVHLLTIARSADAIP